MPFCEKQMGNAKGHYVGEGEKMNLKIEVGTEALKGGFT